MILSVALPVPLSDCFDYSIETKDADTVKVGSRVLVKFGRRQLVGVVCAVKTSSNVPSHKLKAIDTLLDTTPVFTRELFQLLLQAASYYHHPAGEVMAAALPLLLRKASAQTAVDEVVWLPLASSEGAATELARAPRQAACFEIIAERARGITRPELDEQIGGRSGPLLKSLAERGLIRSEVHPVFPTTRKLPTRDSAPELSDEQRQALDLVQRDFSGFSVSLIQGVTGSGKTEVYLALIATALDSGGQALVIAPEISLTPQLLNRFQKRLGDCVVLLHSGLNDSERMRAWRAAQQGLAKVVIGTRSAVFSTFQHLAIIIVDEEHDPSLKQHEGFRYHARDLAVLRGKIEQIPVVLGSATPSMESLYNARQGRYQLAKMTRRAGAAIPPRLHMVDLRRQQLAEGLSRELIERMRQQIARGNQVLLFLNRRGYTPVLLCSDCGKPVDCPHCDAHTTWHASQNVLRCHHCGFSARPPSSCPGCDSEELITFGLGTQKIEQVVQGLFPNIPTVRIDRDSMRKKDTLQRTLKAVEQGKYQIIIGTQMLAKGHDFPDITLVGVIDVDQGLFSTDFRAQERLAQQILQVSGRAGRASQTGEVVLQSYQPENPLLQSLLFREYEEIAGQIIDERNLGGWPPFTYLALIRAAAMEKKTAQEFLQMVKGCCENAGIQAVQVLGPVSAPLERRAGRYRQQLLLRSPNRGYLHRLLEQALPEIRALKTQQGLRWSLDIDPLDLS